MRCERSHTCIVLMQIKQQRYANQLRARLLEHDPTYLRRDIKLHAIAVPPTPHSASDDDDEEVLGTYREVVLVARAHHNSTLARNAVARAAGRRTATQRCTRNRHRPRHCPGANGCNKNNPTRHTYSNTCKQAEGRWCGMCTRQTVRPAPRWTRCWRCWRHGLRSWCAGCGRRGGCVTSLGCRVLVRGVAVEALHMCCHQGWWWWRTGNQRRACRPRRAYATGRLRSV